MRLQRMKATDALGEYIKTCAVSESGITTVCGMRIPDSMMVTDGHEAMGVSYKAPLSECNCHECRRILSINNNK